MTILNNPPEDHPPRNTPLGELNAEYRWKGAGEKAAWRTVKIGAPKIVGCTFNELGESWTNSDIWRVNDG